MSYLGALFFFVLFASFSVDSNDAVRHCPPRYLCCPNMPAVRNTANNFQCCPKVGAYDPRVTNCPTVTSGTTVNPNNRAPRCPAGFICCRNKPPVLNPANNLQCCKGIGAYDPKVTNCPTANSGTTVKPNLRAPRCPSGFICCPNKPPVKNAANNLKCCLSIGAYDPKVTNCPTANSGTTIKPNLRAPRCPAGFICCPNRPPVRNAANNLQCCPRIGAYDPKNTSCPNIF